MSATEQVKLQEITIGNSDFKDVIDSGSWTRQSILLSWHNSKRSF